MVDAARNDLAEFCQLLDSDQDACWHAYEYLTEQQAVCGGTLATNRSIVRWFNRRHNTTSSAAVVPPAWSACRRLCGSS